MGQHTYYLEGQQGCDLSKPRTCPKCGGKSYSSNQISGKAKCPHCGHAF